MSPLRLFLMIFVRVYECDISSLSTDSNLIIKRWCIVPFQRCIQQCINALMHRTRAAPHLKIASQSSSPRCLPLTANILKTTSRRHQATTNLPSPCPHHHRGGGQDDESLKFCNGPGRPSQDGQTKNLHCNVHPWLFHIHNQNLRDSNIIIRLQIIIDEGLACQWVSWGGLCLMTLLRSSIDSWYLVKLIWLQHCRCWRWWQWCCYVVADNLTRTLIVDSN